MRILRALYVVAVLAVLLLGALSVSALSAVPAPKKPSALSADSLAKQCVVDAAEKDADLACELLDGFAEKYRYLDDATVVVGITPAGEEAVAYYTEDQIVISRTHTVSVEKILAHEIWHVIDWHDNGRLDWGEDLPPQNMSTYLKR